MPRLQGLIFDLDGTLVDSVPDLRQALNLTLEKHGRRPLSLDEVTQYVGDGMLTTVHRAFAATGAPIPETQSYMRFQEFISFYRGQKPDPSQIYPHVLEALPKFKRANVKLGICTNKQEAATLWLLKQLSLIDFFTFVAGGDTFVVHKPHPDHVLGVIERLGVPKEGCVMVGDSSNDVQAAQRAGIPCIAVAHGYGPSVGDLGANAVIEGFKDLDKAIAELGFQVG